MSIFSRLLKRKNGAPSSLGDLPGGNCPCPQDDSVTVTLPMLTVTLTRKLNTDIPHEVHVIIPRAEIRIGDTATEIIYSSITVVHAPRHPLAGEQPPGNQSLELSPNLTQSPGQEPLSPAAGSPEDNTRQPRINIISSQQY